VLAVERRIAEVGGGLAAPQEATVVDGRGHLTLPGLVDARAHLDKTPLGPALATPHRGRGRPGGADRQRAPRPGRAGPSGITVAQRAGNLLGAYVAAGTSHIRSHVDVDPDLGLTSLQGVMEARAAFADQISVELVAFPETGLLVRPGTARAAGGGRTGRRGADRRPGPGRLRPPVHEHLDTIFAIAAATAAAWTSTTAAASWSPSPST
jgi:cytosine deaminase